MATQGFPLLVCMLLLPMLSIAQPPPPLKQNFLFFAVDDLRPEIGAYGRTSMHTPNLDKLIAGGTMFRFSYVQQAVCSPSRTSLLTGRRPDTTHVYDLWHYFRNTGCNVTTLPQYFKEIGYRTAGHGKVFHPGHASNNDDPPSWTEPYYHSPDQGAFTSRNHSWLTPDADDSKFPDVQVAEAAISRMRNLSREPFFLAVGFHKPHLPFVFPKRFLDYYPQSSIHIAKDPNPPKGMPKVAWSGWGELRNYQDIKDLHLSSAIANDMPNEKAMDLRRAYFSAITYMDEQVGKVLSELTTLGLDKNTTVVLWGDHGWQLGEHAEWCKHTNFELATRAPLIIRTPLIPESAGSKVDALVEHVDIYPTLVDLAGFEPPSGLQGSSLVPLLKDPSAQWDKPAFSQYPRNTTPGAASRFEDFPHTMGYSVRTTEFRYTEWVLFDNNTYTPNWEKKVGVELYSHHGDDGTDMEGFENENLVDNPQYADTVKQLSEMLHAGPKPYHNY